MLEEELVEHRVLVVHCHEPRSARGVALLQLLVSLPTVEGQSPFALAAQIAELNEMLLLCEFAQNEVEPSIVDGADDGREGNGIHRLVAPRCDKPIPEPSDQVVCLLGGVWEPRGAEKRIG